MDGLSARSVIESDRQVAGLEDWVSKGRHRNDVYGNQWGDPLDSPHLFPIVGHWIFPERGHDRTVLEIGSGGGRWSKLFRWRSRRAILVDATEASEAAVRSQFPWDRWQFVTSRDGTLPEIEDASVDYCFSFDTFVHFLPDLFDAYLSEIGRVLRPGRKLHIHHARKFSESKPDETGCFLYRTKAEVDTMAASVGLIPTGREHPFSNGWGSVLCEFVREGSP